MPQPLTYIIVYKKTQYNIWKLANGDVDVVFVAAARMMTTDDMKKWTEKTTCLSHWTLVH
jgi:hypothetical protein